VSKSLSQIIAAVGDDKVQCQVLANDLLRAKDGVRDCEITFATERGSAIKLERNEVIGLVVWINRKDYEAAITTPADEP
jgi:hypothetical protein